MPAGPGADADRGARGGAEAVVHDARDGRAKGERRRRALIEATVRVIAREGASGVTHRSVAPEAGLPTTATTYCFDGIGDLLAAALPAAWRRTRHAANVSSRRRPGNRRARTASGRSPC
ncbi:TetR/AcrR family transcriptional regulator [Streptomyces silaceus]|uniref:TetR/AcrR family transcriptional regulator n=1 Tax=Streptomyces silaceus TaxID=545123 RepID=UPI000AFF603E|nr:hypothetical protein [Streptomyces silaceus]